MTCNNLPIGFIDSGFGGLTVVKECLKQLPNEIIYFIGDSARCPYGPRTAQEVSKFTWEMVDFLLTKQIKLLVIACNTATAAALHDIKQQLSIPVIGVVDPGSRSAIKQSVTNRIGVIGTQGTITSNVYPKALMGKKSNIDVISLACPPFVSLVEEGRTSGLTVEQVVKEQLAPLKTVDIDTLILGCTHYPILKSAIRKEMGDDVLLIDSGAETINDVSMLLDYFDIANYGAQCVEKQHRFFTTGNAQKFELFAKTWLPLKQITVEKVNIPIVSSVKKETVMSDKTLLIATKNPGKAKEFQSIFGQQGFTVKTLLDFPDIADVEETGRTFEDNARLKAETISKLLNIPVIADDSGLLVDALDGQPGVYSARYAGEPKSDSKNNAKLLAELSELGDVDRSAKFHCTLVLAIPGKESIVVSGELHGEIASVPVGENGFGYDPLFYVKDLQKTTAQLTADEKNRISHRQKAIQALIEKLPDLEL